MSAYVPHITNPHMTYARICRAYDTHTQLIIIAGYENIERPEIIPDLPKGGVDIQDVPLFWNLPSGRCSSYSVHQLRRLPEDEFLADDSDAAYLEMGKQFR